MGVVPAQRPIGACAGDLARSGHLAQGACVPSRWRGYSGFDAHLNCGEGYANPAPPGKRVQCARPDCVYCMILRTLWAKSREDVDGQASVTVKGALRMAWNIHSSDQLAEPPACTGIVSQPSERTPTGQAFNKLVIRLSKGRAILRLSASAGRDVRPPRAVRTGRCAAGRVLARYRDRQARDVED